MRKNILLSLALVSIFSISAWGACATAIDFGNQDLSNMKLATDMNASGHKISSLVMTDPIGTSSEAANKNYVDTKVGDDATNITIVSLHTGWDYDGIASYNQLKQIIYKGSYCYSGQFRANQSNADSQIFTVPVDLDTEYPVVASNVTQNKVATLLKRYSGFGSSVSTHSSPSFNDNDLFAINFCAR